MNSIESTTPLSDREARKSQLKFQQRKAAIAGVWSRWQAYYKETFEAHPDYERAVRRIMIRISQEIALEANINGKKLEWDDARERVLTPGKLDEVSARFGKRHADIRSDLGKMSNHIHWYKGVYQRGEGGILADVVREMRDCSKEPQIVVPPKPVALTAKEISDEVARRNEEFAKVSKEFLGDSSKVPKTATFGFMADVDREMRLRRAADGNTFLPRKPRRNWRKEI